MHIKYLLFRYKDLKHQYEIKSKEAEMLENTLQQGTHHQQLKDIDDLKKSIGKLSSFVI